MLSSVLTLTFEVYIESRFASSGSGKEADVVLVMAVMACSACCVVDLRPGHCLQCSGSSVRPSVVSVVSEDLVGSQLRVRRFSELWGWSSLPLADWSRSRWWKLGMLWRLVQILGWSAYRKLSDALAAIVNIFSLIELELKSSIELMRSCPATGLRVSRHWDMLWHWSYLFTGASCTCLAKSKLDFLGRAHHDPPSSCSAGDHCRAWAGTVEFLQLSDHKISRLLQMRRWNMPMILANQDRMQPA